MPEKIGRYRIVRRIGSGAFATVWLGADDALDAQVAIKVLADNWSYHSDLRMRFEQEARIMRRADSVLLVRVLDVGELPDGRPYLVMPFVAGGTLADRLSAGPLPVREALRVAVDIGRAVAALHEAGVLHRDLKPSNVLFEPTAGRDRVLVADLGLAKALANASGFTIAAGTPGYMPPEQATPGGGLDTRADVYAIGATLYHMLTGRPPEPGWSGSARTRRPSQARPGLPSMVDELVTRALQPDPRQRWDSATAMVDELERVTAALERETSRTRALRWLRRTVGAGISIAAVLAATGASATLPARYGWVRVHDAGGDLSVAVPPGWAGELKDDGWNPSVLRLPAGHAPGLVAAPDLAVWPDPASAMPGVFVGASRALLAGSPTPALPSHPSCVEEPQRTVYVDGNLARVRRWTSCGSSVSFSEVVFAVPGRGFGVYVQVKQVGDADVTDEILASLRVSNRLAPQAGRYS
ncbi:serine/threonine protein kinase [Asanoa ferruginea]|uniref:non-specific serine/threonine protein kinase n=1 Tax=Asanoa ferruginea TaxID=53367 RepID=A0A3D9ZSZ8_9ACTN|nr:serine/threonine protein kinase [Asanoa ferruginea]GIF47679.1 serine/threonine protein kinase [Asanoa ferruginea]